MRTFKFRPWGRPDWLRAKYGEDRWCHLGCHGFEKRSVKSLLGYAGSTDKVVLIRIDDPLQGQLEEQGRREEAYSENRHFFDSQWTGLLADYREPLKASLDRILEICAEAADYSGNVTLDITSFPKRWFFPMVRYLCEDEKVRNLVVVYTKGSGHADSLSENPETLRDLPSFVSVEDRDTHDFAFVGVGFHTHSLHQLFDDDQAISLQLLFPFPPGPPGIHRNWRFVQEVEMKVQKDENSLEGADAITYLHLDAVDVSQVFDAMRIVTEGGAKTSVMAPYGPKPFSLAMCLFALACEQGGKDDVPVKYSQPQKYSIGYTEDAAYRSGRLDSWAYAIKQNGNGLYKI
jgi:hypothetical protein